MLTKKSRHIARKSLLESSRSIVRNRKSTRRGGEAAFDSQKRSYKKRKSSDDSSNGSKKRGKSEDEGREVESQGEVTENNVQVPNEVMVRQKYTNQPIPLNNLPSSAGFFSSITGHNGFANANPHVTSYPYSNAHIANIFANGLYGTTPFLPAISVPNSVLLNKIHNSNHQDQISYYVPACSANTHMPSAIPGIAHGIQEPLNTLAPNATGSSNSISFNVPPANGSRLFTQEFGSAVKPTEFIRDDSLKFGLDFKTLNDSQVVETELLPDDSLKILDFRAFNGKNCSAVLNPEPEFVRYSSLGVFDGCDEPLPLGQEVVSAFARHDQH